MPVAVCTAAEPCATADSVVANLLLGAVALLPAPRGAANNPASLSASRQQGPGALYPEGVYVLAGADGGGRAYSIEVGRGDTDDCARLFAVP